MDNEQQNDQQEYVTPYYQQQADTWWNRARYFLMQIWPYITQLISFLVYETIKTTRGAVKVMIEQIKFR